MRRVRSIVTVCSLLVASLLAELTATTAIPAAAEPSGDPEVTSASVRHRQGSYSAWEYRFMKAMMCTTHYISASSTMDHRRVVECFAKNRINATRRRQMMAGFWDGGGSLSHVSKRELGKIKDHRERKVRWRTSTPGPVPPAARAQKPGESGCLGQTGQYWFTPSDKKKYNKASTVFFDSCDVADVIFRSDTLGWMCGAIAVVVPILPGRAVGAMCFGGLRFYSHWWSDAKDRSTTASVYTVSYYHSQPNSSGRYPYDWYIFPQDPR